MNVALLSLVVRLGQSNRPQPIDDVSLPKTFEGKA